MNFEEAKRKQFAREDKSSEGKIDYAILNLCGKINNSKDYYTTSSCSGRIVLIKEMKEKAKNVFLFKSHGKISFLQLKAGLKKINYKNLVYFKQEPCILHVACNNLQSAWKLLQKARFAGWKRSGMIAEGKRVVLELMSTEKIEMPIADKGKILVNDDYLKRIVKEANKKLERVREKIQKFEELLSHSK